MHHSRFNKSFHEACKKTFTTSIIDNLIIMMNYENTADIATSIVTELYTAAYMGMKEAIHTIGTAASGVCGVCTREINWHQTQRRRQAPGQWRT